MVMKTKFNLEKRFNVGQTEMLETALITVIIVSMFFYCILV